MPEHIVTKKTYFWIFAVLMVLTFVTTAVGMIDLGPFNVILALLIAVIKGVLVVLFFMHIYYGERLTQLVVVAGTLWLFLLLFLTSGDYFTREWLKVPGK
jgi:cytochrome c oxidase subunit 4